MELAIQIRSTVHELLRQRLVFGRRTTYGCRDVQIPQSQAVVAVGRKRLVGEAYLVQHRIHEVARRVPCERAPSAVRAMRSRSQAEHDDAGVGITEARHRFAPILPIAVGSAFLTGDLLPISYEAWATCAGNHFLVQVVEPLGQDWRWKADKKILTAEIAEQALRAQRKLGFGL
jgi:hypothetical protein